MSATVQQPQSVTVIMQDDTRKHIDNPYILTSYSSKVAVYDRENEHIYLLPKYAYSNTTTKHVHAFIADYTRQPFTSYADMRKDAKGAQRNYTFIEHIKSENGWLL